MQTPSVITSPNCYLICCVLNLSLWHLNPRKMKMIFTWYSVWKWTDTFKTIEAPPKKWSLLSRTGIFKCCLWQSGCCRFRVTQAWWAIGRTTNVSLSTRTWATRQLRRSLSCPAQQCRFQWCLRSACSGEVDSTDSIAWLFNFRLR